MGVTLCTQVAVAGKLQNENCWEILKWISLSGLGNGHCLKYNN